MAIGLLVFKGKRVIRKDAYFGDDEKAKRTIKEQAAQSDDLIFKVYDVEDEKFTSAVVTPEKPTEQVEFAKLKTIGEKVDYIAEYLGLQ